MSFDTAMTRRGALRLSLGVLAAAPLMTAAGARAEQSAPEFVLGEQVMGDPDAPVTVIEYASLTCPHCRRFHETVFPRLKREYIDTGKVRLIYREVYFDRLGLWGGMLARCGGKDRYFGFIDALLRGQENWTRADDVMAEFKKIGRLGGLTDEQVEACLRDEDKARALVEMYQGYRDDPRLTGTPTLIVGEEKVEQPSFERLSAAIDKALAG
ncbi:DsbA family protein [Oceanicella actignis]|uniref:Thioredoxin n=1 Tax=Oceanicella actignis TaxID=1189325 RepID=A0A1M7TRJ5_9RHOB|nr:DsbA family protein [Oceanicella actignis]TYO85451.1 thioredoxin-like protein [Oceanicella actignis]SET77913.1 Thioredoxin [Oceanicella actignis]SHN73352.1 Thioredoxin [Oceanicella actignis]